MAHRQKAVLPIESNQLPDREARGTGNAFGFGGHVLTTPWLRQEPQLAPPEQNKRREQNDEIRPGC
jgi:hypothetical protein